MSGVNNGQLANQTSFNNAFISRNGDGSTVGKLDLLNFANDALSGTDIVNLQKNVNALCSALGISPNQAADLLITWASTGVGTTSQSAKAKIDALVALFHATTGHGHSGVAGDGPQLSALDLADINLYRAEWQTVSVTAASGTSVTIATEMGVHVAGGGTSTPGVITSAPSNKCWLIDASTETFLEDTGGQRIYGRITYPAGLWTLSFYTNEAGVETAHTLSSTNIRVFFLEVFRLDSLPTIPSSPADFGTLDVTGDVKDATATVPGKVSTGTQTFAGNKTFNGTMTHASTVTNQGATQLQGTVEGSLQTDASSTGSNQVLSVPTKMIYKVTNATLSIGGFTASSTNYFFFLINGTGADLTVKNALSSATSDILTGSNSDLTMKSGAIALIVRDTNANRWLCVGGAGGGGAMTVSSTQTLANGATVTLAQVAEERVKLAGSTAGAVLVLPNGTINGQKLWTQGASDSSPAVIADSGNVHSNGDKTLLNGNIFGYMWDSTDTKWYQMGGW